MTTMPRLLWIIKELNYVESRTTKTNYCFCHSMLQDLGIAIHMSHITIAKTMSKQTKLLTSKRLLSIKTNQQPIVNIQINKNPPKPRKILTQLLMVQDLYSPLYLQNTSSIQDCTSKKKWKGLNIWPSNTNRR